MTATHRVDAAETLERVTTERDEGRLFRAPPGLQLTWPAEHLARPRVELPVVSVVTLIRGRVADSPFLPFAARVTIRRVGQDRGRSCARHQGDIENDIPEVGRTECSHRNNHDGQKADRVADDLDPSPVVAEVPR